MGTGQRHKDKKKKKKKKKRNNKKKKKRKNITIEHYKIIKEIDFKQSTE
jgi:hypothetical protein